MGLRPAHCYRESDKPAYTRLAVTVHDKNYIGASPGLRTRQFNMGNPKGKYSHIIDLVSTAPFQIRDNALESGRNAANRQMVKAVTKEGYFMRIRVYPYQILRENKQATGAGADRVTKGMAHPFGKPIGRAVRVKSGTTLMSVLVDQAHVEAAKKALWHATYKIPGEFEVRVGTNVKSIGSLPKRTREEKVEEKVTAEAAATTATGKEGEAKPAAGAGGAKGGEKAPAASKSAAKK